MSETYEENNVIQKEEPLIVVTDGMNRLSLSIIESSMNVSQETGSIPVPVGPPPMPERWHGTSFPKAYSLGFSSRPSDLLILS